MTDELLKKENQNFVRLFMLISQQGTDILRKALFQFSTETCGVATFKEVLAKAEPHKGKINPSFVPDSLWPACNPPEFETQLDITACNALLNLTEIIYLTVGKKDPQKIKQEKQEKNKKKKLIIDTLHKIKNFRNQLCHNNDPKISDSDFTTQFDAIKQIFKDIEAIDPTLAIADAEIEKYRILPVTHDSYKDVLKVMQQTLQEALEMKKDIAVQATDISTCRRDIDRLEQGAAEQKTDIEAQKQDIHVLEQNYEKLLLLVQKAFPVKEDIPPEYVPKLQKSLKTRYQKKYSFIHFNPVNFDATTSMDKQFVKLSMVEWNKDEESNSTPLSHYREIFKERPTREGQRKKVHRVVVSGRAGIGKTTLSKKIACDWASDQEEALQQFEMVFVITLRKVEKDLTIVEIITDQLLPYKDEYYSKYLEQYINENKEKVLFVFDGLDEIPRGTSKEVEKMIKSEYLENGLLVVTSRPSQAYDFFRSNTHFDIYSEIVGFKKDEVKEFIEKFFSIRDRPEEGQQLFDLILEKKSHGIVEIPLVLDILCMLYAEEGTLPDTVSDIYKELREFVCKRQRDETTPGITDEKEIEKVLLILGEIAFEGLINDQLYFPANMLDEKTLRVGLVAVDKDPERMKKNTQFNFLHKSIQENLAAFYLARETENDNLEPWNTVCRGVKFLKDFENYENFLRFCVGESQKLGEMILDFFHKKLYVIWPTYNAMEKIACDADLSSEELATILKMAHLNMARLTPRGNPIDDWYFSRIFSLERAIFNDLKGKIKPFLNTRFYFHMGHRKSMELNNCLAICNGNEDLEFLVKVSWLHLSHSFVVDKETVSLLKKILAQNAHMVYISMDFLKGDPTDVFGLVQLLKVHPKVKYVYLSLSFTSFEMSEYEPTCLQKFFQELLEFRNIFGLRFDTRFLPHSCFKQINQIFSQNSVRVFHVERSRWSNFQKQYDIHMLNEETTKPLDLKILKVPAVFEIVDEAALSCFLRKCPQLEVVCTRGCKCEVSSEIISLKFLTELDISGTVDSKTKKGLDVGKILEHLGEIEHLQDFRASTCRIDDTQIQKIKFQKESKLTTILLANNNIGKQGIKHICENAKMLPNLKILDLEVNLISFDDRSEMWQAVDSKGNSGLLEGNFFLEKHKENLPIVGKMLLQNLGQFKMLRILKLDTILDIVMEYEIRENHKQVQINFRQCDDVEDSDFDDDNYFLDW